MYRHTEETNYKIAKKNPNKIAKNDENDANEFQPLLPLSNAKSPQQHKLLFDSETQVTFSSVHSRMSNILNQSSPGVVVVV